MSSSSSSPAAPLLFVLILKLLESDESSQLSFAASNDVFDVSASANFKSSLAVMNSKVKQMKPSTIMIEILDNAFALYYRWGNSPDSKTYCFWVEHKEIA